MTFVKNKPKTTKNPHRKLLAIDDELLQRITDFRFEGRFPSESEAIRELIRRGLLTTKKV